MELSKPIVLRIFLLSLILISVITIVPIQHTKNVLLQRSLGHQDLDTLTAIHDLIKFFLNKLYALRRCG